jgi:hypothetical protein
LCGDGPGTGNVAADCLGFIGPNDNLCRSALCSNEPYYCSGRCCKKSECGGEMECVYVGTTSWTAPACWYSGSSGTKKNGESCSGDSECYSRRCRDFGKGMMCTDVCCTDNDCNGSSVPMLCRPVPGTPSAQLFCVAQ